jgi:hypothetical protein
MNVSRAHIDLTTFRDLVTAATDVVNVWHVRVPSMPWKIERSLQERVSLVSKLEASLPYRAIWLSDWTSDEQQGWRILTRDERLSSLDDELKNGAWALFFFEDQPDSEKLLELVPSEPPDATAAIQSVRKLGASAAIWSWYDNYEWLVVLPTAI